MTPAQEFCLKAAIAIMAMLAIGPAMYVLGKQLLLPLMGHTPAVVIAGIFGLVAWICIFAWFKRQFDEWWGHVQ